MPYRVEGGLSQLIRLEEAGEEPVPSHSLQSILQKPFVKISHPRTVQYARLHRENSFQVRCQGQRTRPAPARPPTVLQMRSSSKQPERIIKRSSIVTGQCQQESCTITRQRDYEDHARWITDTRDVHDKCTSSFPLLYYHITDESEDPTCDACRAAQQSKHAIHTTNEQQASDTSCNKINWLWT